MSFAKLDKHVAEGGVDRLLQERARLQHNITAQLPLFYRYVVLDVVFDTHIVDADKISYWEHDLAVSNIEFAATLPRNTIIARRVKDASVSSSEQPMFLFPFFPSHLAMPCKPGEHVWVMFEAPGTKDMNVGYWFCRITECEHVDDVNHTHPPRTYDPSFTPNIKDIFAGTAEPRYEYRNGRPDVQDGERFTVPESELIPGGDETAYEKLLTDPDGSQLVQYEAVPRYRKRPGDFVLEGSNNTLLALGTDRLGPAADLSNTDPKSGKKPAPIADDLVGHAGVLDIVAGRGQTPTTGGKAVTSKHIDGSDFVEEIGKSANERADGEGDPDLKNDRSRVRVSQRTKVDTALDIDKFNASNFTIQPVKDPDTGAGAIIIKTDKVRIIARMDLEILVPSYETDENGNVTESTDPDKFAAVLIRSNGDIIFRPAKLGVVKLGGDDADLAVLCVKAPNAGAPSGAVVGIPITNSFGGVNGAGGGSGQWAKKVLVL